jgi:hypothetical protein
MTSNPYQSRLLIRINQDFKSGSTKTINPDKSLLHSQSIKALIPINHDHNPERSIFNPDQ